MPQPQGLKADKDSWKQLRQKRKEMKDIRRTGMVNWTPDIELTVEIIW